MTATRPPTLAVRTLDANAGGLSTAHKTLYGLTALAAGWIAFCGLLVPAQIGLALAFPVPELHARFFGAIYLSGTVLLVGALFARRWTTIRLLVPLVGLWTGLLLLASLPHLDSFHLITPQAAIWFGAYLLIPVTEAWLAWQRRGLRAASDDAGAPNVSLPRGLNLYLAGQGVLLTAVGLLALLAPDWGTQVWPWTASPMLVQIYGAPLLAYGVALIASSWKRGWAEVRLLLGGLWVFAVAVLVASLVHRELFSATDPAAWLWFGSAAAASCVGLVIFTVVLARAARRAIVVRRQS